MAEQTSPELLFRNESGETTTDETETGNWTDCGLEVDVRACVTRARSSGARGTPKGRADEQPPHCRVREVGTSPGRGRGHPFAAAREACIVERAKHWRDPATALRSWRASLRDHVLESSWPGAAISTACPLALRQ